MHRKLDVKRIVWFVLVLSLLGAVSLSPAALAQDDYTIDPPLNLTPILPTPPDTATASGSVTGTIDDEVLGSSITAAASAVTGAAATAAASGGDANLAFTGSSVEVPLAAGAGLITLGSLLLMMAARRRQDI